MANAYCLWRHSKSPMQSNLSPDSLVPPFHSPSLVHHHRISVLPNSMCPTNPVSTPLAASVNSFCHALSDAKHHHSSYPCRNFSVSRYISISLFLYLSHFSFASNDIYAILIEYLLYMRLHIQAFSHPLPSTVSHTFASLQCLCRWPKICEPSRIAQKPIPVVVYAVTNLSK